ncbi:MAG: hypothetical protein AABY03_01050 [Nanoarchaeota archaeon]
MSKEEDNIMPPFVQEVYSYPIVEKTPLFMKQDEREKKVRKRIYELFKNIGENISAIKGEKYNLENFPPRFLELNNGKGSMISGGMYILFYKDNPLAGVLVMSNESENTYTFLGTLGTLDGIGNFNLEERIKNHFSSLLNQQQDF